MRCYTIQTTYVKVATYTYCANSKREVMQFARRVAANNCTVESINAKEAVNSTVVRVDDIKCIASEKVQKKETV